ncbi:MAG: phosphoribosylformylglycinamidine cyclo-ligase, partial [Gammaproteobacteria bacterium]
AVIHGIGQGCLQAGATLIGGETAEMPELYAKQDYDLAGFCVGAVDKRAIIKGDKVAPGHILIGLASSGPHANGYSLIHKILRQHNCDLDHKLGDQTLAEILLTPAFIYVKPILQLIEQVNVLAIAHITGGGLIENIPRVIPKETKAVITANYWQIPPIFQWLQQTGRVSWSEMYRTFNCGIGMVVCVAEQDADQTLDLLEKNDQQAWPIGRIEARLGDEAQVVIA